jgi:hypothetical protein
MVTFAARETEKAASSRRTPKYCYADGHGMPCPYNDSVY